MPSNWKREHEINIEILWLFLSNTLLPLARRGAPPACWIHKSPERWMVGIWSFPIGWNGLFWGANWLLVSGRVYGSQLAKNPRTNLCNLFEGKSLQNEGITHWHLRGRSICWVESLGFVTLSRKNPPLPPTNHKNISNESRQSATEQFVGIPQFHWWRPKAPAAGSNLRFFFTANCTENRTFESNSKCEVHVHFFELWSVEDQFRSSFERNCRAKISMTFIDFYSLTLIQWLKILRIQWTKM